MVLYVESIASFCFPYVVDVSALSICIVLRAFVVVFYVSSGSRVSPNMFVLMFMGSVMLSICSASCVLHSAESGVKRVHVGLSGMFVFAMFMFLCVDVMVMSSVYVVSFTCACGVGVSDVYMLNSVGDLTSNTFQIHCLVEHQF